MEINVPVTKKTVIDFDYDCDLEEEESPLELLIRGDKNLLSITMDTQNAKIIISTLEKAIHGLKLDRLSRKIHIRKKKKAEPEGYSEDIKTCKKLINILQDQIKRTEEGTMFLIPGTTPEENIKVWEAQIKKHQSLIDFLEMGK